MIEDGQSVRSEAASVISVRQLRIKSSSLTLVRRRSSQDGQELLCVWSLRVDPFLDGPHRGRPAAQVLLRLDECGQIDRLRGENLVSLRTEG